MGCSLFLLLVLRERSDHYIAHAHHDFFAATSARDGTLVDGLFQSVRLKQQKSRTRVKTKERVFEKFEKENVGTIRV